MQQGTQPGRIIITTEKIAKPGGPSGRQTQRIEPQEAAWHGVAILYSRQVDDIVELRLFYESHISQQMKDEITARLGIMAIEWNVECA